MGGASRAGGFCQVVAADSTRHAGAKLLLARQSMYYSERASRVCYGRMRPLYVVAQGESLYEQAYAGKVSALEKYDLLGQDPA